MWRTLARFLPTLVAAVAVTGTAWAADCRPGRWLDPASRAAPSHDEVIARAAGAGVVLLGETHDDPDHHRWQLSVLAGLLARRPDLAVGFEALPASAQPALDRWVAGKLGEAAFLDEVGWERVWGLPAKLYLPLFHLARMHRVRVVGLNVERRLVARVGREGWGAVPIAERQGVGDPAAPSPAYVERLAGHFRGHGPRGRAKDDAAFRRFVEAQLTWDRAMAEALARARRTAPLVVGIVGSEHLRHREGIPHQLADLGIPDATVLLPETVARGCGRFSPGEADAVFLLDAPG